MPFRKNQGAFAYVGTQLEKKKLDSCLKILHLHEKPTQYYFLFQGKTNNQKAILALLTKQWKIKQRPPPLPTHDSNCKAFRKHPQSHMHLSPSRLAAQKACSLPAYQFPHFKSH